MEEENGVINRLLLFFILFKIINLFIILKILFCRHQKKKTPKKSKDPEKKALIKKESIHDLQESESSKKL